MDPDTAVQLKEMTAELQAEKEQLAKNWSLQCHRLRSKNVTQNRVEEEAQKLRDEVATLLARVVLTALGGSHLPGI